MQNKSLSRKKVRNKRHVMTLQALEAYRKAISTKKRTVATESTKSLIAASPKLSDADRQKIIAKKKIDKIQRSKKSLVEKKAAIEAIIKNRPLEVVRQKQPSKHRSVNPVRIESTSERTEREKSALPPQLSIRLRKNVFKDEMTNDQRVADKFDLSAYGEDVE